MHSTQVHRFSERLLSTVHRGTAFEYRALSLLTKHLSMSLTRVGGSHDGGIDLIGWWWVPCGKNPTTRACRACSELLVLPLKSITRQRDATPEPSTAWNTASRRRLRVLAQCKAEKRKMGPAYLRELEGVVYRHAATTTTPDTSPPHVPRSLLDSGSSSSDSPPRYPTTSTSTSTTAPLTATTTRTTTEEPPPIALLVSESAFTRHCLLAAHASSLPFLLVHLPPDNSNSSSGTGTTATATATTALGAVFGNPALLSARGVLRGELEIRWERGSAPPGVPGDGGGRPRLWWQGEPLPSWTPDADADSSAMLGQVV